MAAYGTIYQFSFDSANQVDFGIFISKKDYTGPVYQRALGKPPVLRRERNGYIAGTSLELAVECKTQGEFSSLYTSSADEYLVEVYCHQRLLWQGYVTPELYSEPDIPAPYDVQIIATDGLGELKSHDFMADYVRIKDTIESILTYTGLSLDLQYVSSLKYTDDTGSSDTDIFEIAYVDLEYMNGKSCYDALAEILSSFNMVITQQAGKWYLIRENDLYESFPDVDIKAFGSMDRYEWWPIGNMSLEIMPAKKSVKVSREYVFKSDLLKSDWSLSGNAYYNNREQVYILPGTGDSIVRRVDWYESSARKRLALKIQAQCLSAGNGDQDSRISVRVKMIGGVSSINATEFYLSYGKPTGYDSYMPVWSTGMYTRILRWSPPGESDSGPNDLQLILPLFTAKDNGYYTYAYANSIEVTLINPNDDYPIAVHSCALVQYDQPKGVEINVSLNNGARESDNDIEVLLDSVGGYDITSSLTQQGMVVADGQITSWQTPRLQADTLLKFIAQDYALADALPRNRYRGKLHVSPQVWTSGIPLIFQRDDINYFVNTYSYDLYNDEVEVELVSVPNATIEIEDMQESVIPATGATSQSSAASGASAASRTVGSTADLTALAKRVSDLEARLVQGLEIPAGKAVLFLDTAGNKHTISYDSEKNGFCVDGNLMSW